MVMCFTIQQTWFKTRDFFMILDVFNVFSEDMFCKSRECNLLKTVVLYIMLPAYDIEFLIDWAL